MEIGLIYSRRDPRQAEARDFLKRYLQQRGITASIIEHDQPVDTPTVIINGQTLKEKRTKPREAGERMFPDLEAIATALDLHAWTL